ncbi:MAG: hypothetical protein EBX40_01325 [Gammaproteobacteria bacterium]|nr:hypothetical protein [Gammaproteobacteria bacterium]
MNTQPSSDIRYYTQQKDKLITAISIPEVLKQLPTRPSFNHRYLTDYFLNGYFASEQNLFETLFEGIYRVPIGYQLKKSIHGVLLERAWQLEDEAQWIKPNSFEEAVECFRGLLTENISERLTGRDKVAVELSGGLDSSSVAALARYCRPHDALFALTHGVPEKIPAWFFSLSPSDQKRCQTNAYDECTWSRQVSQALQLEQHMLRRPERFHHILEKYTEVLGSFSEVLFPLLNHSSYELCNTLGVHTLLSGFGGDELLTQQHLGLYWKEQKASGKHIQVLWEKIKQKRSQDWLRYFGWMKPSSSFWRAPDSHLEYLKIKEAERSALPIHETLHAREKDYIEGAMSLHWQRRIETSQILAKAYGIDYQCPLTHPRLMQFFYQLPSEYKYWKGKNRAFMRHCMSAFLPKAVVWRDDKAGGTAPEAWFALVGDLPELFLSRITSNYAGVLKDYLDIPKLIQRIEKGPVVDSNLVRLMVAVLMFVHLEQYSIRLPSGISCGVV